MIGNPKGIDPISGDVLFEKSGLFAELKDDEELFLAARSDAKAVWVLADASIPNDIRTLAKNLDIPELANEIFRAAFILGWRARDKADEIIPKEKNDV